MAEHFYRLRVAEIVPETADASSIRFELPEGKFAPPRMARKDRTRGSNKRGRPANIRHQGRRR